ncbi:MAG: hydroxymethylglutaryl-CoA lyase [Thermodesulfobacteriota bacterium]
MMKETNYPDTVNLVEVGPRDGFQLEPRIIPLDLKVGIIQVLVKAGLKQIQVASFVNPKRVPQMADVEAVIRRLDRSADCLYTGLALNLRGVERAHAAGLEAVEISISASDTHSRKNAGLSLSEAIEAGGDMIRTARDFGMRIIAGIQCAFGCVYEGAIPVSRVAETARRFQDLGVERISLADTTGMATPRSVNTLLSRLLPDIGKTAVGLHLHDTRGLGLVNLTAGLGHGISWFDTAFGGMGGCPFVTGAAGNIATEDTDYLLTSLGIDTGIDRPGVSVCSRKMARFLERSLPGKLYRVTEDVNAYDFLNSSDS